jgi:HEPN domain-containing protein
MAPFVRDENDWLRKLSPDEWIRAALGELRRAEAASARHDARAAIAGCKRAAGMALNAALLVEPDETWGRTYTEHVAALADDGRVPEAVRRACRVVRDATPTAAGGGGPRLVALRTPAKDDELVEATKDVMAHAYAVVKKHET